MKSPKVSIVSITYNHEDFIREALEGFVGQRTDFNYEIIISDDASTDGTQKIIQEYVRDYPDLFKPILRDKNVGIHGNLIAALQAATGDYIALCEGDDYWTDPEKLQKQADFLDNHPDYAICFHPTRVFYEGDGRKESIWPHINKKSNLTVQEMLRQNFIPTNAVMYRRQQYDHLPTNTMPFDWYLHLYHAQFGKIGFIDKTMSAYRRHPGGVWAASYQDTDQLWKKWGIAHVATFVELLKLYGGDPELKEIMHTSLGGILNTLMEVDNRLGDNLLQRALKEYPEALGAFMNAQHQERELLSDKDHLIEELNKEIVNLREQIFRLKGEIHQIRTTPGIGHLIKFKALLGRIRRRAKRDAAEARELVRRLIPAPARRFIKRIYTYDYKTKLVTHKLVSNRSWPQNVPLVSVVIPFYNRVDTIDDTLNSLSTQTYRDFETIIVDDGSTEESSLVRLSELEKGGMGIRIIRQPNQGVSAARNTGVKNARGKYVICLDSDDLLDSTYIEKCTVILETAPDVGLVTTHQDMFGVTNELFIKRPYDAQVLYSGDNMVITAAEFRKEAWRAAGGYKTGIGYEDWEFWISLSEHGFWGKLLPEPLFKYRTSMQSRYVDDKGEMHWKNMQAIRELHPKYKTRVKQLLQKRQYTKQVADPKTALVNLADGADYAPDANGQPKVLITIPWMTFGGAETLIYNYCREIKEQFNISFITGLQSEHQWEYKFREISTQIYHLANLFEDQSLYLEFISNYIQTRHIDVLHIIHNGFTFDLLPELKRRFPKLKVAVTLFNDRVEYFDQSIKVQEYIDVFSTDNSAVAKHFQAELPDGAGITVIPNGINCLEEFNAKLFDRHKERTALGLAEDDLAVFFVGRLSEEKNPDVFLNAAESMLRTHQAKRIKFFIVGDGPMRPVLEKQLGVIRNKNITMLGYHDSAGVARLLSAADVFVLPSAIEGFPLSILEAMSMGLAIIASRVGAIPDILEPGSDGYIVRPGSATEIAGAVSELDSDRGLLAAVKLHTRDKAVTKYSTTVLGDNYRRLYRGLTK